MNPAPAPRPDPDATGTLFTSEIEVWAAVQLLGVVGHRGALAVRRR